ncbi:putative ankyrin repeat-containing domain-containing protein [Rosa chinensis]|uniref:Putative ankyrin repeat-containing domain-containing protein n=1 Tax=Rosa chinensis TaxID=74649 RepID=A0A2P6R0R2_ROSCH|nr:ankyrin repeat and sterile alpha motif domain-containing protein 1B [Rosa chinensis]PRQ39996.1 putative ankyrin repeat-containing domain-containing protein [Rosa chinensis]
MPPSYFPLRWESTGDQWWYASPIDWAAANGLYDLVSELLHLDTNLLIKLTSLRRIRRLETVWDDEAHFNDVAKCRSQVAKRLLNECQTQSGHNSLIRAGYGGWLLYTAASAGDVAFVKELLARDPLLVFGEGEYGVTDIFYAAARSKNAEVFRLLLDFSVSPRFGEDNGELEERMVDSRSDFKWEMMNRAVHAAARGGNLEVLKELVVGDCGDVLVYRDAQGSTVLHTASGRGQIEVVKYLIASFDISTFVDSQGNTALHVAAYRGHLAVVEVLIGASPSLVSLSNYYGDSFLHMAVAGFRAPGFRRVDKQIELIKQLVCGDIVNMQDIVNDRNNNGRTALHIAVSENIQSSVVELLMTVPSIDLNIRDGDGMTALDILKQRPKSPSSELLIKQLISAGGISKCQDHKARNALVSHLRMHGIGSSPGTSFRIPDAEIFLYTGNDNASDASGDQSCLQFSRCSGEISQVDSPNSVSNKKTGSVNYAARSLKFLLQWPRRKVKKESSRDMGDADSLGSYSPSTDLEDSPIPLRQMYLKSSSLPNSKRILSARTYLPSPYTKMRYTAGLTHGVIQAVPQFAFPAQSHAIPLSRSSMSSPSFVEKEKGVDNVGSSRSNGKVSVGNSRQSSFNRKLINQYLCVGAQGVEAEESVSSTWPTRSYKHSSSLVA